MFVSHVAAEKKVFAQILFVKISETSGKSSSPSLDEFVEIRLKD